MEKVEQCYSVLIEGPATTREVSIETGIELKLTSAFLSKLRKKGRIKSSAFVNDFGIKVNLWELSEYPNDK